MNIKVKPLSHLTKMPVYATSGGAGMTQQEREALWRQMSQLFDNNIEPYMEFRQ